MDLFKVFFFQKSIYFTLMYYWVMNCTVCGGQCSQMYKSPIISLLYNVLSMALNKTASQYKQYKQTNKLGPLYNTSLLSLWSQPIILKILVIPNFRKENILADAHLLTYCDWQANEHVVSKPGPPLMCHIWFLNNKNDKTNKPTHIQPSKWNITNCGWCHSDYIHLLYCAVSGQYIRWMLESH